jgi:zinc transport system substrate-binding protein
LVNTSRAFKEQYIKVSVFTTHTHGPGGEHAHAGMAFTTWIDFQLAVGQAVVIRDALMRLVPEEKERFEANFSALKDDLMALDRHVGEIVEGKQNQLLVASHPVYDYFARRYGLNVKSVLWEPEEFPSQKQWSELGSILKLHPAKWMIWEGKPNPAAVDKLKLMGVSSLVFDPTGNVPDEGDFLSIMRQNVENLRAVFSK